MPSLFINRLFETWFLILFNLICELSTSLFGLSFLSLKKEKRPPPAFSRSIPAFALCVCVHKRKREEKPKRAFCVLVYTTLKLKVNAISCALGVLYVCGVQTEP